MSDEDLLRFAASRNIGALTTIKKDGRPQLSMVSITVDPEHRLARISITATRAKTRNLRRDPRASLLVTSQDGWSYVVLEGDVELTPVARQPGDATVEELIEVFRAINGEHSDWDEYRAAMVHDQRLVARLHLTHAYGVTR